ncbi:MAG: alpha-amylase [Elusimicrobia bacterium]|nr:alpha-amylase [Elusimicrobiota bacterium]
MTRTLYITIFLCLLIPVHIYAADTKTPPGVFYEIFVRSFYDSDGNGIGDFKGLTKKLDYLNDGNPDTNSDLEVKGIWLMPVCESPSDHGYDVTDYYKINRDYGTEEDFMTFLQEAHKRGIIVIIDLVLNHTSIKHPWFSDRKNWYIWKNKMPQGWMNPWGSGTSKNVWHYKNGGYYYGAFSGDMPDLNYNNKEVITEMKKIIKYWLDKGADGFRLDGARYIAEKSGGVKGQADLEETHEVLSELVNYGKSIKKDCMFIGEVWTNNRIVSSYYGQGDELDCAFNFDLQWAMVGAAKSGDYKSIENILNDIAKYNAPENFYSAFLSNHDMHRTASQLDGNEPKLKQAAALLLSMKGIPFMYYGEEIGMTGGAWQERTPMQWSADLNAGFTQGSPWKEIHADSGKINVELQEKNKNSLLSHYKNLIRIRNKYRELYDKGKRKTVNTNNSKIYSYAYIGDKETLLYIYNFEDKEVKNVKINLREAGLKDSEYTAENLLNKNKRMDDLNKGNINNYNIDIKNNETIILKITRS